MAVSEARPIMMVMCLLPNTTRLIHPVHCSGTLTGHAHICTGCSGGNPAQHPAATCSSTQCLKAQRCKITAGEDILGVLCEHMMLSQDFAAYELGTNVGIWQQQGGVFLQRVFVSSWALSLRSLADQTGSSSEGGKDELPPDAK